MLELTLALSRFQARNCKIRSLCPKFW